MAKQQQPKKKLVSRTKLHKDVDSIIGAAAQQKAYGKTREYKKSITELNRVNKFKQQADSISFSKNKKSDPIAHAMSTNLTNAKRTAFTHSRGGAGKERKMFDEAKLLKKAVAQSDYNKAARDSKPKHKKK